MSRAVYVGPWRIDLDERPSVRLPVPAARLARAVGAALDAGGAPAPASIGLILSNDKELAALNAEHLHEQGATDVLSFPLLPPEAFPAHHGGAAPEGPMAVGLTQFARPPGFRLHLGDIVVSVERAIEQAEGGQGGATGDVRWSPADELRLLVTHGALHVCGWDHALPEEEAAMRALEDRLLTDRP